MDDSIGSRIRIVRKHFGLNQSDFARRIGIKQSTVSGIESGLSNASDIVITSIAREFLVSRSWLLTGEGEMLANDEALASVITAMAGQSESKKRLLRIIAEMPDPVLDKLIEFMEQGTLK